MAVQTGKTRRLPSPAQAYIAFDALASRTLKPHS